MSAPTWSDLTKRAALVTRAQVISPIATALHDKRAALVSRTIAHRRAEAEVAAHAENDQRVAALAPRRPARPMIRGSFFTGADGGRLMGDWNSQWTFSPDYEIRWQFRFMRARARDLVRNNPYASGFAAEIANQVIGPKGVLLQARVKNRAGDLAESTNDEIERAFQEWGYPDTASADGHDSWIDIQTLVMKTLPVDGEVFLRRLRGYDNDFGYALQFIDADLVDEYYNLPASSGQNEIRMGVEVNGFNRPVAYHIWNRYLSEQNSAPRIRQRMPADEIIHLFVRYRPNQTRGVSWFAPILASLHFLDGYEFAELQAARASAAKMGWIKNVSDAAIENYTPPKPGEEPKTMEVEPGLITELLPGQEFEAFDPTHPSTAYKDFTCTVLRAISRGLNISYSTLTGDLSQANYGSQRGGLLAERDHYRGLQEFLICHLHRPVYRDWIKMALLVPGAIGVDSRLASDYADIRWLPRGYAWIDPLKDLQATKLEIDLGLNSRTRAAGEVGYDHEEIVEELAEEQALAESYDVDTSGNQIAGVRPLSVSPEGQVDDSSQPGGASDSAGSQNAQTPKARLLRRGVA